MGGQAGIFRFDLKVIKALVKRQQRLLALWRSVATRTCRNRVAKQAPHDAPNNVVIGCVEMLRSFGRVLLKIKASTQGIMRCQEPNRQTTATGQQYRGRGQTKC